jgi:integrase
MRCSATAVMRCSGMRGGQAFAAAVSSPIVAQHLVSRLQGIIGGSTIFCMSSSIGDDVPPELLGYQRDPQWRDMSDYLVHFTKASSALVSMLAEGFISPSGPHLPMHAAVPPPRGPFRARNEDRPAPVLGGGRPGGMGSSPKGTSVSVQRTVTKTGLVRYRARIKSHGREVATRVFARRGDAVAWEQDQARKIRDGDWVDPRRGRVSVEFVSEGWLATRASVKRRTRETDELAWKNYIAPSLAARPVGALTSAEIAEWVAALQTQGRSAGTARRALATLRAILDHAIADNRLSRNVARPVRPPHSGKRREGQGLTADDVDSLAVACKGPSGDVVTVLGYTGLRWGELAGLQVGDRIAVPGPGLRLQRAVLAGSGGKLFIDTLKNHQARTVPLPEKAAEVIAKRSAGRAANVWIFASSTGTPLREGNWKRAVAWAEAKQAIGRPTLRVHDLRHSAASIWLGAGADPKVVQRVLGHATATMTLDLYGHLIDANLWTNAKLVGGISGASTGDESEEDHA